MPTSAVVPELVLRFGCRNCHTVVHAGLSRLEHTKRECPTCGESLRFPELDWHVQGVDAVLRMQADKCVLPCPSCGTRLKLPPAQLSELLRCTKCKAELLVQLVSAEETKADLSVAGDELRFRVQPVPHSSQPQMKADTQPLLAASSETSPEVSAVRPKQRKPSPSTTPPPRPPVVADDNQHAPVESQEYKTIRSQSRRRQHSRGTTTPRMNYLMFYYAYRIALPPIVFVGSLIVFYVHPLFTLIGLFVAFLCLFPRIPQVLANYTLAAVTSSICCPGCGFEIDAVDRWAVGGFQDYRERNIYVAYDPIADNYVGHINCPQCSSTIRVR